MALGDNGPVQPDWAVEMAQTPPDLPAGPLKEYPLADLAVAGFKGAGAHCGLKKNGKPDLALIAADQAVPAAGVFTSNPLTAAPVVVSREHVSSGFARAIIANSGGANAATGHPGLAAARACCQAAAQYLGCPAEEVLPCSTGVIGYVLNSAKVAAALPGLAAHLSPQGLSEAAAAIMTTDAFPKTAREEIEIHGRRVAVAAMAKGAGMIRPDMATMLAFVLTDAAASPEALSAILKPAADLSFNRATVDGDTSTNDTLLLLASGAAGNPELSPDDPELAVLGRAVAKVCQRIAEMMVADGEGAGHLVQLVVAGAESAAQAQGVAYAIAHSPLCKTAFYGEDANWGRVLSAAATHCARNGQPFEPVKTSLKFGEVAVALSGLHAGPQSEDPATAELKKPRWRLTLDLGLGQAAHWLWTSDLGHEYVDENASYRS